MMLKTPMLRHIFVFAIIIMSSCGDTKQGKFKIKLVAALPCEKPEKQMDPDKPMITTIALRKISRDNTVIDVNVTSFKKFGPVTFTFRAYQLQQNAQKNLISKLEKATCSHPIFKIGSQLHLQIDKDCYMLPGTYQYKSLDVNIYAMIVTKSLAQPGKYAYELEFDSPKGTVTCFYVICDVKLIKY